MRFAGDYPVTNRVLTDLPLPANTARRPAWWPIERQSNHAGRTHIKSDTVFADARRYIHLLGCAPAFHPFSHTWDRYFFAFVGTFEFDFLLSI